VTRRLARQLVRDVNAMSIREVARRHDLPWHFIMALTRDWSDRVAEERRRRRCRVLLIDETSLRRGHRYVTVLINGDTGQTLGIVAHRNAAALSGFLVAQGHRWLKGVNVVVSDGSGSYRSAIAQHLGHATHVLDRFHGAPRGARTPRRPGCLPLVITVAGRSWGPSWRRTCAVWDEAPRQRTARSAPSDGCGGLARGEGIGIRIGCEVP